MQEKHSARLGLQLLFLSTVASIFNYRLYHQFFIESATGTASVINSRNLDLSFSPPLMTANKVGTEDISLSSPLFSSDISESFSTSPPWAFFYNVYMPSNQGKVKINAALVNHILDEQLHQVGTSYAATYGNTSMTLYYNTIGHPINHSSFQEKCHKWNPRMKCIHMKHYDQAFEEKTLASVHQYCQEQPHHRVGYIHNKGSFNSRNSRNHWWRRHMTMAVTDRDCMHPPDNSCDICGLNFYALPFIHFSGNFFTARCSYINKLLPIEEFRDRMSVLANQTKEYEQQGRFLFHTFPRRDTYLGLDRYASEAWPGSHPSVVACDLSTERKVDFWKKSQPDAFHYWNFSLAPRSTDPSGKFLHVRRTLRNKSTYLMREYWLLAGNIFKWIHLYDTVPHKTSWVWNFFPNGEVWRNGYTLFGNDVVESLLGPFAMKDGNLSLPIYENVTKYHFSQLKLDEKRARQRARRRRRRQQNRGRQSHAIE
ncbi:hypothetical protein IV203_034047 [Nitzschia inconspicua]|uniref:Uncharacterized protein n=1 Tax=Nitzschia inconspicua TaxID=303405 RepID=A0A9K3M3Z9_9STRA|nr:hypothetical protein IV203_034047 [Nitzschia inconspicua]